MPKLAVRRVFLSLNADAHHSPDQNAFKWGLVDKICELGYLPEIFTPPPGKRFRGLTARRGWTFRDAEEVMQRCSGHVLVGMPRWRAQDKYDSEVQLPTEYHHYEGALSHLLRLPTLLFSDPDIVNRGVFNRALGRFIVDLPPDYSLSWLESEEFKFALNDWHDEMNLRRDVFLGYSSNARGIANSLKRYIETGAGATVLDWHDDFPAGDTILSRIKIAAERCTVGIFLFTRDDILESEEWRAAPRDNVVFEAGYFANAKGHSRILIVLENGAKMPADLGGQIYASLENRSNIEPIERRVWSFLAENL